MKNENVPALTALRAELDRIDDTILKLIEQRLDLVAKVAQQKKADAGGALNIRPRREREVITRLQARSETLPGSLVADVWREIMGHCLQAQGQIELVLHAPADGALLEAQVRAHYGSAPPLSWAESAAEAIARAERDSVIAVLTEMPQLAGGELTIFDTIRREDGTVAAYAIGRVAAEDVAERAASAQGSARQAPPVPASSRIPDWSPESWRRHVAAQMPVYPDAAALARVESRLAGSPPLVAIPDIIHLKALLGRVSEGRAFLVQGGDCAESFAEFGADKVRMTFNLLLHMGAMLRATSGAEIVHLARIAGQFAKPRSSATETIGEVTLPSYRGDAVNGPAFIHAARTPDPRRLLDAHRQAQVTIELLHAYAAASYADLPPIHRAVGLDEPPRPVAMFTSHEALLLNYEQALTRFDEATESWWATSGHMVWIGDRTRSLDGAHVEFARGVANPVGLKCGPSISADDLLRLIDRIDPDNQAGRLVLIGRFGADKVAEHLPRLMRATCEAGRNAVWSIDPMHGNTRTAGRHKTRLIRDIVAEIETFFAVADSEGVHAGGMHLEMTGADVTECLGGSAPHAEEDLPRRYLTHCDPRLNQTQALDVAAAVAELLARGAVRQSNAA